MADKNKDTLKDIIDQTVEKVEPQIKKAKEKAKPYIDKAQPTLDKAKEKAKPYIDKVEPAINKAVERAEPVVKEAVTKAQKATTKTELFLQYNDYELRMDDIVDKVREDFLSEGKKAGDLKKLRIYIKPEDHAAYYVANGHDTGKVML